MDVQRNIEAAVEKRTRETYGPPPGKKLLIFIDDMNMPLVDTYGTQQPIAFLKFLFEKGGFYDRGKDLSMMYMKDMCKFDSRSRSIDSSNTRNNYFSRQQVIWQQWENRVEEGTKWIQDSSLCSPSTMSYFPRMRPSITFTRVFWSDICKYFQRRCKKSRQL